MIISIVHGIGIVKKLLNIVLIKILKKNKYLYIIPFVLFNKSSYNFIIYILFAI